MGSAYEDRRKGQNREAQRRYRHKMRKKKKGGSSDDDAVHCDGLDAQVLSGLDHVNFEAAQCDYRIADNSKDCGDATGFDYEDYSRLLQPNSEVRSAGVGVNMEFGEISWSCTPGLSTSSNSPPIVMPLSPTSLDQSATLMTSSSVAARLDTRIWRPESDRCSRTPAVPGRRDSAHAKIVSKACGMVEELRKLYSLGVELELLQQEIDVPAHLDAVEELICRSGKGAQNGHGSIDNDCVS